MKKIEMFFSSPMKYEKLTVEIQLDRECIIEINQDNGLNHLEVELFGTDMAHGFVAKMPLDDLINILIDAKRIILSESNSG